MKYVMIPINKKWCDDGIHVRRVLISYKSKKDLTKEMKTLLGLESSFKAKFTGFNNSRLVTVDPYFTKETSTHKYTFKDDGYTLDETPDTTGDGILTAKFREYHTSESIYTQVEPIFFTAKTDKLAIDKFNSREELRD